MKQTVAGSCGKTAIMEVVSSSRRNRIQIFPYPTDAVILLIFIKSHIFAVWCPYITEPTMSQYHMANFCLRMYVCL